MNTSRNSSVKRKRVSNSSQAGMYSEGTKVAFQFEYFSLIGKRSRLSAEATRHVTSVFGRLVTDAGITLSFGDGANFISKLTFIDVYVQ